MKTLVLFSLSLAVALAMPPFPPGAPPNPNVIKEEQSPLLGDVVPVQGHVEVEAPAPQPKLDSEEQEGKVPVAVVNVEQMEKQSALETEVKEQPQVQVEKEGDVKEEVKVEVKEKPEVKVEEELKAKPEVKQVEMDPEPDLKVESEVKVEVNQNSEVMAEQEVGINPDAEMEPEPDLKVESEVKVEPDVQIKPEAEDNDMFNEEFQVHMKLEAEPKPYLYAKEKHMDALRSYEMMSKPIMELEPLAESETDLNVQEKQIDMERNFEMMGDSEPIMHLEPLDDDKMFGGEEEESRHLLEVQKSIRAEFMGQGGDEEEEEHMRKSDILGEEPIVQPDPEMEKEPFQNEEVSPDAALMGEGPALDVMGKPMSQINDYFPNEEAKMRMEPLTEEEGSYYRMKEPESLNMQLFQQENGPGYGGEEQMMMRQTGQRSCLGVVLEGKCYQFFKTPKRAEDAEYFCQTQFPHGHLASITNSHIHIELMNLMRRENGVFTRTWIGGLRYLETGRFIWLDGSHWGYADWLIGEPNHTSRMENCLEVLANGKFNDFTCWEPQPFICSCPYQ